MPRTKTTLQRVKQWRRLRGMLALLISACRACRRVCAGYATGRVSYPRKITTNALIPGFRWFSVEIIEEKIHVKVIHSSFYLGLFSALLTARSPETRDFGRTPVAQINS